MANVIVRNAVRALILSEPGDRLLLVRLFVPDSGKYIWLAPGGGIEAGETPLEALHREVWEETGATIQDPVGPVWHRSLLFRFRGEDIEQHEQYFLLRMPEFAAHGDNNPAANEAELLGEYRWWTVAEIAASDEIFVPLTLAQHLRPLIRGEIPAASFDVGM